MKPHCTFRQMLVHPKDKRDLLITTEVSYCVTGKNCKHGKKTSIGEPGRKFGKRLEHRAETEKVATNVRTRATRKASQSTVHKLAITDMTDHVVDFNHVIDWEEARIVGRKSDRYKRWVKEAIAIMKQGTTMNRDEGQYQLSHVFDDLLKKSSGNFAATQQSTRAVNSGSSLHQ